MPAMDTYFADLQRRAEARQLAQRQAFFDSGEAIPDLEMWPDCSICGGPLELDEVFYCVGCEVAWPTSGMGGTKGID